MAAAPGLEPSVPIGKSGTAYKYSIRLIKRDVQFRSSPTSTMLFYAFALLFNSAQWCISGLGARLKWKISGAAKCGVNIIFGGDRLVYLKVYIESAKPKPFQQS